MARERRYYSGEDITPLRSYLVVDSEDIEHVIKGHFIFNNGEEGLVIRRNREDGSDKTRIVGAFAKGAWKSYKETE